MPDYTSGNNTILTVSDIEIGAVELKNASTDDRATINAANTARATSTIVVATQIVDAVGKVPPAGEAVGNAPFTKITDGTDTALVTAGGSQNVLDDNSSSIKTAVETIDNFISGTRGLVTEDNSAAIKTAVETIDNAISGNEMQVDVVSCVPITITKTLAEINDWTAVAQNTISESATYDFSAKSEGILHIQAALDTTTAHTGTRFIVQTSAATAGDEDWQDLTEFIALIGTAATDLIENNPLAAAATSITLTAHALTVLGTRLFIEDATLINSELIFESAQSANAITIIDGTTNAHAVNTAIFNVAMTQNVSIPKGVYRLRVLVDNTYDTDGSTLNYKIRIGAVA